MSDTIPQDRSPRSPGLTLADSINLTSRLFDAIRSATVAPDIAVKPLGYGGTNGAAMGTLATLAQYGLVDRASGKVAITPLAIRILHPKGDLQREQSIREAALTPKIMRELYDGYFDCAESVITGHLIQNGFNADRAKRVAAIHVSNKAFAKLEPSSSASHEDHEDDATDTQKDKPLTGSEPRPGANTPAALHFRPYTASENSSQVLAQYTIPLGANQATLVFTGKQLTSDDFDALIDFVGFSKRQFERALKSASSNSVSRSDFPKEAIWKNKDHDAPVTITGVAGTHEGKLFYQSSTGTGILASELEFQ